MGGTPLLFLAAALWGHAPAEEALARARRTFPAVAALRGGAATLEPTQVQADGVPWTGFRLRPEGPARDEAGGRLQVFFPRVFGGLLLTRSGGLSVGLRPRGANPARASLVDGLLVYPEAYRDTDLVYTAEVGRSEEFLLLRTARAPRRIVYDLVETAGLGPPSLRDGEVVFPGLEGEGLVIERPWLIEGTGRRVEGRAAWRLVPADRAGEGPALELAIDPEGLEYPLLVDPTWITMGNLAGARAAHTATLLNDGRVLVAGGGSGFLATSELFDPATGAWTAAASLITGRNQPAAVLLPDGRVLVTGGFYAAGPLLPSDRTEIYDPVANTWTATGSLNVARARPSMTLLADGRVLLTAGTPDLNASIATSEIYDPATGVWTLTGSLNLARRSAALTRLPNGEVLISGGVVSSAPTATAERYDPGTGLWTPTGSLNTARYDHATVLLPDGRVLAVASSFASVSCELYDPATGTWTPTGNLNIGRVLGLTATLLPDGRVLVAGAGSATTETYDPGTGAWTPSVALSSDRNRHTATLLADGRVLVAGGFLGATAQSVSQVLDPAIGPATGAWTTAGSLASPGRRFHVTALLPDGRVLVAGGISTGPVLASSETFDPATNSWTSVGALGNGRYRFAATVMRDGRVLASGGQWGGPYLASTEAFDPLSNTWSPTGSLTTGRAEHTSTLLPCGEVLVVGGESSSGVVLASAERYDPVRGTWRPAASLAQGRWRHTATLLPDGRVLVTGGFNLAELASAEIYDPNANTWSPAASMSVGRVFHTATLLPNGRVLVAGRPVGVGATSEIYNPALNNWTIGPALTTSRDNHTATLLPNGKVLLAGGDGSTGTLATAELYDPVGAGPAGTGTWIATGSLPASREDHTATLLLDGRILVAGGGNPLPVLGAAAYDAGRGENPAWRATLATATSPLAPLDSLLITGSGFRGLSEASGGAQERSSPSDYPLVQLRRLDNGAVRWLPADPGSSWSDVSFRSRPLLGQTPGPAVVTAFTNGIPSGSRLVSVECAPPTVTTPPTEQTVCAGDDASFSVVATGDCPSYSWRKNGSPLTDGGHYSGSATPTLEISPAEAADAASYDVQVSLACSSSSVASTSVALTVTPLLASVSAALTGPSSVCASCTGGTAAATLVGGGVVGLQWGYRLVSLGAVTPLAGETGATYTLFGGHFPGPGNYLLVLTGTPTCGTPQVSNEIAVSVTDAAGSVQFLTATATDGRVVLEWLDPDIGPAFGATQIVRKVGGYPTGPGDGTTVFLGGTAGTKGRLEDLSLANDTTYHYAAFVSLLPSGSASPRYTRARPFATTGPVKWAFSSAATAVVPPGLGAAVVAVSNDRTVHSMRRGALANAGEWPAGWTPVLLPLPAQARPPVVPTALVAGSSRVVFLSAQDGHVRAVDADTGALRWQTAAPLGSSVQGAVAAMFVAFGGGVNQLFVGTRNASGPNLIHALDPSTGAPVGPPFDNGGGAAALGIVSGGAAVDYPGGRVFFTSRARAGGSAHTLWALDVGQGGLTKAWSIALGDIDGSPVVRGDRIYVGNNAGVVHSVRASDGADLRSFATGDGPVKGFIFPDRFSAALYLSTTNRVFGLTDGASLTRRWPEVNLPGPSTPLLATGTTDLYVGGRDGRLHRLDLGGASASVPPVVSAIVLGDGLAAIGPPTYDVGHSLLYVGSEAGFIYAVSPPF